MWGQQNGRSADSATRTTPAEVDVVELVDAARHGDGWAWDELVGRFLPLVRTVARGYRLDDSDVDDVAQIVWLRLFEHLVRIREPRALPKWIITTTRHESGRLGRKRTMTTSMDSMSEAAGDLPSECPEVDTGLLRAEQARALRAGLDELPATQRDLLLLLVAEPPVSYREISRRLGIPVGSIGPTRARGLARLGATSAVRSYRSGSGSRPLSGRACPA